MNPPMPPPMRANHAQVYLTNGEGELLLLYQSAAPGQAGQATIVSRQSVSTDTLVRLLEAVIGALDPVVDRGAIERLIRALEPKLSPEATDEGPN